MRSSLERYLPVVYLVLTVVIMAAVLPTSLRPPTPPPPTSAEFSPDAPPDEHHEVVLSELARGVTATAEAPAFPIEKVRAAFPALEREVNGKPIAYLDSGASAQRVLASIQAVDRYERAHHSNVHRGSHTLSAEATAAYEGARATVADHIGAADRREIVFVRNATEAINLVARAWGDANVRAGDRIVLTEMEHHSNIVPWRQLAERMGAVIDWVGVDDDGLLIWEELEAALPGAPVSGMAAYAAAKGGVVTLMRAIAAEEKAHGVRANALAPTAIRTRQNLASMGSDKNYVERETVAAWVLWLTSEESGPVSGQVIRLG